MKNDVQTVPQKVRTKRRWRQMVTRLSFWAPEGAPRAPQDPERTPKWRPRTPKMEEKRGYEPEAGRPPKDRPGGLRGALK